ncbi:hypothetical protein [Variovorax sp. J31P207]|uniref:hypothetical protein n=1 Tax=Variovorax sp. J31P207 TaxID=3053510 RepID=UPI0025756736|nr:hypothetical protein [Variovorax sp. J31P207]MDM0067881.1 hypothetical protein [Variovorax sp. J31P207]
MKSLKPLALAAVLLAGCATSGPKPALNAQGSVATLADAGPRPASTAIPIDAFKRQLKDPEGVRVRGVQAPGFLSVESSIFSRAFYGWAICFDMNTRNGMGGYGGYRKQLIVVRNDELVAAESEDPGRKTQAAWLLDLCEQAKVAAAKP